jgi:hypothetical protein
MSVGRGGGFNGDVTACTTRSWPRQAEVGQRVRDPFDPARTANRLKGLPDDPSRPASPLVAEVAGCEVKVVAVCGKLF